MTESEEKTRISIESTGDDQYEAIVEFHNGHKVTRVFPTHDDAHEWALQQELPAAAEIAPEDNQDAGEESDAKE